MSDKVTFYFNPMTRSQIVRWALEEADAPYEEVLVNFGPEMRDGEYAKINPMKKVPAIIHHGETVTECAAICAYLADVFPENNLAPRDHERARYYRWLFFAAGPVEQAVTSKVAGWIPDEKQQGMFGFGDYDRTINVLDGLLSKQDFACGERFTMADVYVGSQILWGLQFGTIEERPAFASYRDRLISRPALAKAKARDDELIAEMQTD